MREKRPARERVQATDHRQNTEQKTISYKDIEQGTQQNRGDIRRMSSALRGSENATSTLPLRLFLLLLFVLSDFAHQCVKGLVYAHAGFGRRVHRRHAI